MLKMENGDLFIYDGEKAQLFTDFGGTFHRSAKYKVKALSGTTVGSPKKEVDVVRFLSHEHKLGIVVLSKVTAVDRGTPNGNTFTDEQVEQEMWRLVADYFRRNPKAMWELFDLGVQQGRIEGRDQLQGQLLTLLGIGDRLRSMERDTALIRPIGWKA